MIFRLQLLRFTFRARDTVCFPTGQPANILRGALGTILHQRSEAPDSAYARIFAPRAGSGPSGLHDPPRPFVFRAAHLDGAVQPPGSSFHFDLHFFDVRHPEALDGLVNAFAELAHTGLGQGRGRAELTGTESSGVVLSLDPPANAVHHVTVEFRTPTELKSGAAPADRPEFPLLAARIRDRLSTLATLYGDGPLPLDFRGFGERALAVVMTRCEVSHHSQTRRSSRTGQTHPLGGFTGQADYQGELAEFVPYLEAAAWTGVGRQTVWGKGEIAVRALTMPSPLPPVRA